jgi:predicted RND superfamily exporter protein
VLLAYLPVRQRLHAAPSGTEMVWARRVQQYRWLIILGALFIGGVCVVGAQRNVINDHASHYFKDRAEFKQATLAIEKTLTGLDVLAFSLGAQRDEGVNDPAYLALLDEFTQWLRQQPEVVHVRSYTDVLKRINRAIHGNDSAWYRLPDSEEMAAQYLLVYSMSTSNGLGISDRVSFDHRSSRITATLKISNPSQLLALDQRATQWLHDRAPQIHVRSASVPKLFAHIGINNIKSMMQGNVLGVVLIALVLGVAFRSLKFGVISLLPNAFPALVALGLWGFGSGTVNLAVTIVFSITLGIIVYDTIHFLSRYLHGRKQGLSPIEAVAASSIRRWCCLPALACWRFPIST